MTAQSTGLSPAAAGKSREVKLVANEEFAPCQCTIHTDGVLAGQIFRVCPMHFKWLERAVEAALALDKPAIDHVLVPRDLLSDLWRYGNLYTVEGVIYGKSHRNRLKEADAILVEAWERSRLQPAAASEAPGADAVIDDLSIDLKIEGGYLVVRLVRVGDTGWRTPIAEAHLELTKLGHAIDAENMHPRAKQE